MKELDTTKPLAHMVRPVCQVPTVEVEPSQLPLACPPLSETFWSGHPRIYLSPDADGKAVCPYCSTTYAVRAAATEDAPPPATAR